MQKLNIGILILVRVVAAMGGLSILGGYLFFGYGGTISELIELLAGAAGLLLALVFLFNNVYIQRVSWVISALLFVLYAASRGMDGRPGDLGVFVLPGILLSCLIVLAFSGSNRA